MFSIVFTSLFHILFSVVLGDSTQLDLVCQMEKNTAKTEFVADNQENVTCLFFSNHKNWEHNNPGTFGITDKDMSLLKNFPELKSIKLEMQRVTSAGCQELKNCSKIEELMFHYMDYQFSKRQQDSLINPDFMLVANAFCKQLQVLEIKHNFRLKTTRIGDLKPMPKLRRLVLDNTSAESVAVPFIRSCQALEELELHRTKIRNSEVDKILGDLTKLEKLWIRPENGDYPQKIDYQVIRSIGHLEHLKELMLKLNIGTLPFENGLEYLVPMKSLKKLILNSDYTRDTESIALLHKYRPDLTIISGYQVLF
ncbi:hypothetical protein [uncultured Draconibacterium sp.]|uniref:hypothetical protein n=1 Tax=uncultured Draconibacterium sp. TaxID=1573823 RepID=UPI0029C8C108|nr:hypothetical protein [uncultured Draconibacterium sp.]